MGPAVAEAQVDDPDIQLRMREQPIERGVDIGEGALAAGTEHFERHQVGPRRHAHHARPRVEVGAVGRDDTGHRRAVEVVVHRIAVLIDEVEPADHPAAGAEAAAEIAVR